MTCPLAKYSDIFGEVGKGTHSYKILNVAVVDVVATIAVSALISFSFNINFIIILICLFLLGIISHRLFCVNTTIDRLIFGEIKNKT